MADQPIDDLLRDLTPQVLGALVRRFGYFDSAEDAIQEALLVASQHWPVRGVPDRPHAWLVRVATRKLTDLLRGEQARRRREDTVASWVLPQDRISSPLDAPVQSDADDTVILLFLCCHPVLTPSSQIALTLRAVGSLRTPEIARALLTSQGSVTRRISRAKEAIRASGVPFRMPAPEDRAERLSTVLRVLYLIFTEGYAATSGADLHRPEMAAEAIRLTEIVHATLPDDSEITGLLALMLLTDARAPARTAADGDFVPMSQQDRTRWKGASIRRGLALTARALAGGPVGPYQVQAAIAAVHARAGTGADTDWPQIASLYRVLVQLMPSPVVHVNYAVAVAEANGPEAGLAVLDDVDDARLVGDHRLYAVRAYLLERSGDRDAARLNYARAATLATNDIHSRYLDEQMRRLTSHTCDEG